MRECSGSAGRRRSGGETTISIRPEANAGPVRKLENVFMFFILSFGGKAMRLLRIALARQVPLRFFRAALPVINLALLVRDLVQRSRGPIWLRRLLL